MLHATTPASPSSRYLRGKRLVSLRRFIAASLVLCFSATSLALAPDEVLLIANRAVPESEQLARFYARQRQIPDGRIVLLDLPRTETMPAERYDPGVVLPVREFIEKHELRDKIRCAVTFYGVPLRLAAREPTTAEKEELNLLTSRAKVRLETARQAVEKLEADVAASDPSKLFKGGGDVDLPALRRRAEAALERINALLPAAKDRELLQIARAAIAQLGGDAALSQLPELFDRALPATATARPRQELQQAIEQAVAELREARRRRFDPAARATVRRLVSDHFGLFDQAEALRAQADYLQPAPIKALDNELCLLFYDNYPHSSFLPNPLHHGQPRHDGDPPPLLMVSRLDGPQAGLVQEMILGSMVAQRKGLAGRMAIDSRGLRLAAGMDQKELGYARADESLRQLSELVTARTKLSLLHDDAAEVFKPNTAQDVALYVGWYKVRRYTPSFKFVPGAVAYHIASFEMISLRDPNEKGWCRGLLTDGVAATIGPVDEPYLFAFPDSREFFSLLLTGRLTLAEVYWTTLPVVNWKMVLVGDPLYNPFEKAPALEGEALPETLRKMLPPAR